MAGQLLGGNSCRTGTSHCRQPSQCASSRIIPTKLQMRRNLLAIARNCGGNKKQRLYASNITANCDDARE